MRKIILCNYFLLSIFLGQAFITVPAYGQEQKVIKIKGSYHTTIVKQGRTPANDYNTKNTTVTVRYTIKIKTDPNTGEKVFDLENSTAIFENEFNKRNYVTTPIPITDIKGDPNTGMVNSFKVKSDKAWDPQRPQQSNGLSGWIDVKKKKGNLKSSYKSRGSNPTITSYTFATTDKKPAKAKKDKRTKKPFAVDTRISNDESISYNATTRMLSIHNDRIISTPIVTDPILEASVNFPDFQFTGFTSNKELGIFWSDNDSLLTITDNENIYVQSDIPILYYLVNDNLFYTALSDITLAGMSPSSLFYNPELSSISSPFLNSVDTVLNPSSSDFDLLADFYVTINPDLNFTTLTDNFTESGETGGDDSHFLARPVPVSEPTSIFSLLSLGIFGITSKLKRK